MSKLRRTLFWIHLTLGIATGLVAALMAGTGVVMAFADSVLDLREHGSRAVDPPAGMRPQSLDALYRNGKQAHPDLRLKRVRLSRDPRDAYEFHYEPAQLDYVDGFSGEMRPSEVVALRQRLHHSVEQWHRFFGLSGEAKNTGKWFASWFNVAFIPLILSGLVIWLPPARRWRLLRRSLTPIPGGRGKGTLRSWHLAVGFWVSPFLMIMVLTATTHSFGWVRDAAHRLGGTEAGSRASMWAPALPKRPVPVGSEALNLDQLRALADREVPDWTKLELLPAQPEQGGAEIKASRIVATSPAAGPRFFPVVLQVDPYTGELLDSHSWTQLSSGTRWLAWARWLHKGEAFGRLGQGIAGIACLAMLGLITSGWILALRRLRRRSRREGV